MADVLVVADMLVVTGVSWVGNVLLNAFCDQ
jgi:hypothetical protein